MARPWLSLVLGIGLLIAPVARGGEAEAERYRLQQELEKLAQRNAWSGVERIYTELVALDLPLTLEDHQLAGMAAMQRGEMLEAKIRLQKARQGGEATPDPSSPYQEVSRTLDELDGRYGMVHLLALEGTLPALLRDDPPFSTTEKQAIAFARAQFSEHRAFMGLLPVGVYKLDMQRFEVVAGADMIEITLGEGS
jgi:hypothetical protein